MDKQAYELAGLAQEQVHDTRRRQTSRHQQPTHVGVGANSARTVYIASQIDIHYPFLKALYPVIPYLTIHS